jgi:SOS-response transcriptional repressor LexA
VHSTYSNMRAAHIIPIPRFAQYALRAAHPRRDNQPMNLGPNIRAMRKKKGWTILQLATEAGTDVGNISRLERGKQGVSAGLLDAIAGALGVSVADLYSAEPNVQALASRGRVPLVSWVAAGAFCGVHDPYAVGDAQEWMHCPVRHGPRTFALTVKGDSMFNPGAQPSFADGDIIFVDPDRTAGHRSLVVVRMEVDAEATFKRLLIDGQSRMLEALNPAWPQRIIPVATYATICGVVIAKMESFL